MVTNLEYLRERTKSNPNLMTEMIIIYLDQTPTLIASMKQSLAEKNYASLNSSVHKIIPSFAIVGIKSDFKKFADLIQDGNVSTIQHEEISKVVAELDKLCSSACDELKIELDHINKSVI